MKICHLKTLLESGFCILQGEQFVPDTLRRAWTEVLHVTKDNEAKAHIQEVAVYM